MRPLLDLPPQYRVWARTHHVELAPEQWSPLCPNPARDARPVVSIREPRDNARFLWDPETPRDASGIRLAADVAPSEEDIVWIVDGSPVARVGYPYETTLPLTPGRHTILASLARSDVASRTVTITVEN
jgi:hypothetical protein